ncbi:MAG: putative Ig domain-containing protein [Actinomycetota bacterium]|nr:putative Ig domain-containing protein [Actinomycetota bacterium]
MARRAQSLAVALAVVVGALAIAPAAASAAGTAPVFTADTPPTTATVGTAYATYTFVASGTPTPTYSVASGTLPPGLTLDTTSGSLAGTPAVSGSYTFTVSASNGVGTPATSGSITIGVQGVPVFTSDSAPSSAATGISYSFTFVTRAYPAASYSVSSGILPPGLTLAAATGVLSGIPATTGTYSFTVEASNTVGNVYTPVLSISVGTASAPLLVADSPTSAATYGISYSYTFSALGTPVPTFFVASGQIPLGLSLNSATGLLSGVPTTIGTYSFVIGATNGVGTAAISPPLAIAVTYPTPPVFTADTPPSPANVGSAYGYTFAATGSPAAGFVLASGVLPPGLVLNTTTGQLTGTPTTVGVFTFVIEAVNSYGTTLTPSLSITTQLLIAPVLTRDSPPRFSIVGTRYAGYVFAATGAPRPTFSVSTGALPRGLALDAATGLLSGTPSTPGRFTFTVAASNGVGSAAVSPSITIEAIARPVLTIRAHNMRVVGLVVLVPTTCSAADCRGTIRLRHLGTIVGTVAYTARASTSTEVRVRLNGKGRTLLYSSPRHRFAATATVVDIGARTYAKPLLLLG